MHSPYHALLPSLDGSGQLAEDMEPDNKLESFLKQINFPYMKESFYSVWKKEATHIITFLNIPKEKHNSIYLEIATIALNVYDNDPIPFIVNIATSEVSTDFLSDEEADALLVLPPIT